MSRKDDQGALIMNDNSSRTTKPKSLIQAISEIEQFSVAEMGSEIPEGSLPIATALSFMEVGVKSGLVSGLMTAVTTPLMMAAGQRLIPIFGEYEPTFFNQTFSIALAVIFPVCFGIFLFAALTKAYAGNITRRAIDYLIGGVSTGTAIKTIFFMLFYHYVCFQMLDPDIVVGALLWLQKVTLFLKLNINYKPVFDWLMDFRRILIPSSYFILFINSAFTAILVMALVIGRYRTRVRKEFLKEWE